MNNINLKDYITEIEGFPKEGINFKDISPLIANPEVYKIVIDEISQRYVDKEIDKIVGLDARGFLFGSTLSYKLQIPFVMVRKSGKLPGDCYKINYDLEYGSNSFEIQKNAINTKDKVLLIDDLLATGGSILAVKSLLDKFNAEVVGAEFIVELAFLSARKNFDFPIRAQVTYE